MTFVGCEVDDETLQLIEAVAPRGVRADWMRGAIYEKLGMPEKAPVIAKGRPPTERHERYAHLNEIFDTALDKILELNTDGIKTRSDMLVLLLKGLDDFETVKTAMTVRGLLSFDTKTVKFQFPVEDAKLHAGRGFSDKCQVVIYQLMRAWGKQYFPGELFAPVYKDEL